MRRSALIGMGDIYNIHLNALSTIEDIEVVAVCDINPAFEENKPEGTKFYTDYKAMLKECSIDCVHICLPHDLHYPVTRDIVEMGLGVNVFCEKPLALNEKQAEDFAKLEEEHPEVKIGICLQNRYNETTEMLKEIIDSKKYGEVVGCRGLVPWYREKEYYTVKPWRGTMKNAGGGCMINQSIHTLDLLQFLCGKVASLKASVSSLLEYDTEVEDTVTARLEFKNGSTGVFWATIANSKNESVQISVSLEKADFLINGGILYKIEEDNSQTFLCEDAKLPGLKFYYGASHAKLINIFYKAISENTENYTHVSDAVESIRLIDAINKSSDTKSKVIVNK